MSVNDGFMPSVWQWTATVLKRPRNKTGNVSRANNVSICQFTPEPKNYAVNLSKDSFPLGGACVQNETALCSVHTWYKKTDVNDLDCIYVYFIVVKLTLQSISLTYLLDAWAWHAGYIFTLWLNFRPQRVLQVLLSYKVNMHGLGFMVR